MDLLTRLGLPRIKKLCLNITVESYSFQERKSNAVVLLGPITTGGLGEKDGHGDRLRHRFSS